MEGEFKRMGKLVFIEEKKQCTIGQMVDRYYYISKIANIGYFY